MSRFTGEEKAEQILKAASEWRQRCLLNGGSLFSNNNIWNSQYLAEIERDVVNSQLELEGNFMQRLKEQLAGVSPEAKQLTAEMIWLLFLCASNISVRTKREQIMTIWELADEQLDSDNAFLKDVVLAGVGSAGTGFNTFRAREFAYLTNVLKALLAQPLAEREARLSDGFAFAEWLSVIPENASRQFRHMLMFMLFPDDFERIFSSNDRRTIVRTFKPQRIKDDLSAVSMDRALLEIRREQENKYHSQQLDFYVPPLSKIWQEQPVRHWLMTWNPKHWNWGSLPEAIQKTRNGEVHREGWSCNNRNVKIGDIAWLMRLGGHPKGIFAMGKIVSEPYESKHWNTEKASKNEMCTYIDIDFSNIIDVHTEPFITEDKLNSIQKDNQNWFPQQSGISIRHESAIHLQKLWLEILAGSNSLFKEQPTKPQNLIVYGPPGTGKTYALNQLKAKYVSEALTLTREQWLTEQLADKSWCDVIFMALIDLNGNAKVPAIREHEFVKTKATALERTKNLHQTIWSTLQNHAAIDSKTVKFERRTAPYLFDKHSDSTWFLLPEAREECSELVDSVYLLKKPSGKNKTVNRYEFVTFHQAYSYEDFVEGIRPELNEESGELSYSPQDGVFRRICQRAEADPEHRYAIFIDEINRGNVAKIFGELITLIETDKRTSGDKGMRITLPYSRELFGVPVNLDIYGTMNTADRSIALLDTALRRRFLFKELMPDTSKIAGSDGAGNIFDEDGKQINLRKLLDAMNHRIRFLLSRDLMLGHAYLCEVKSFEQLKSVFLDQLIPLLQEYFYEDWHKIQLVFRDIDATGKLVDIPLISRQKYFSKDVFGFTHDELEEVIEYRVTAAQAITPDSIRKIYED